MRFIQKILFRIARSSAAGVFIRWMVRYMSFLIPAEHLIETDSLIAFYHPRPSYPFHVVIVARDQTPTFCEMQNDSRFWYDLPAAVRELVVRFQLNERGYRLITNGGRYQDVPLLHCHLVSGDADQD